MEWDSSSSFFIINGRKFGDSHMKSTEMICFLYEVYWDTAKSGLDGDIIITVSKSINKDKQTFWRLQYIAWFDVPSVLITSKTGFLQFLLQAF